MRPKIIEGEKAILEDGTKVFVTKEKDGKLTCLKLNNGVALVYVGTKPDEEWEWKCPPESLQK